MKSHQLPILNLHRSRSGRATGSPGTAGTRRVGAHSLMCGMRGDGWHAATTAKLRRNPGQIDGKGGKDGKEDKAGKNIMNGKHEAGGE